MKRVANVQIAMIVFILMIMIVKNVIQIVNHVQEQQITVPNVMDQNFYIKMNAQIVLIIVLNLIVIIVDAYLVGKDLKI